MPPRSRIRPSDLVVAQREGCSPEQWELIGRKARLAFRRQRNFAAVRGIEWQLSLQQWWSAWQESGRWAQRGRRKGLYVMARNGDVGPYALGNIYFTTLEQNSSDQFKWKPTGVRRNKALTQKPARLGYSYLPHLNATNPYRAVLSGKPKKHLGWFATADLARAAYLSALAVKQGAPHVAP